MTRNLFAHTSPIRIFAFSAVATIISLVGVLLGMGPEALFIALILVLVEITFSFENAIINAKILARMSKFWQTMFLTVGIFIAIIGMRVIFPIVIVMVATGLGWSEVVDLALNHPEEYAHALEKAHPQIAAFGGAFLLMLALHFFIGDRRDVLWLKRLEGHLQRYATFWMPATIATVVIIALALFPMNTHKTVTIVAGFLGIVSYTLMHALIKLFESIKERKDKEQGIRGVMVQTGMTAFMSFLYLEMLDASFSFDSVIGAFAVTKDVILIAIGLGIGAVWVRSMTVYMVRNGTLATYKYLEHGAHYTVFVLAAVLLFGIFWHVPEVVAGVVGIGLIGSAILASRERQVQEG